MTRLFKQEGPFDALPELETRMSDSDLKTEVHPALDHIEDQPPVSSKACHGAAEESPEISGSGATNLEMDTLKVLMKRSAPLLLSKNNASGFYVLAFI